METTESLKAQIRCHRHRSNPADHPCSNKNTAIIDRYPVRQKSGAERQIVKKTQNIHGKHTKGV